MSKKFFFNYWELLISLVFLLFSCKRYLDAKPDIKINTPTSLSDLQGILDYFGVINSGVPMIGELSSDDYYLTEADWASANEQYRNYYIWAKYDDIRADWNGPYAVINRANIVLDYLPRLATGGGQETNASYLEGAARFFRAYYHYELLNLFAKPYDPETAVLDPGIPIRQTSDINTKTVRIPVAECYAAIISDLEASIRLLPATQIVKSRPGKAAGYGVLSRVYLSMENYEKALIYADSCLNISSALIDYNTLNSTSSLPFKKGNDEVIIDMRSIAFSPLTRSKGKVDSALYKSYTDNDLRKDLFFIKNSNGTQAFKGNYAEVTNTNFFAGIATDEMYLIRAECLARLGNTTEAFNNLKVLLTNRFRTGTLNLSPPESNDELLKLVLTERRKELFSRTLRWADLRRLNKDPRFGLTLHRKAGGQEYSLEPNSPRYTLQISRTAVELGGLEQNP